MKFEVAFSLSLLLGSASAAATALPWGQCGGQNFVGPNLCPTGQECVVFNVYFSLCRPVSSSTSFVAATSSSSPQATTTKSSSKVSTTLKTTTSKKTSTTMSSSTSSASPTISMVPLYGQCGGSTYWGATVCAPPGACVSENAFFSNCFPTTYSSAVASTTSA